MTPLSIEAGTCLLWLATVSSGLALDPGKSVFQYNCRSWNRQTGFPADSVNSIVQTADGYLWLGTAVGFIRFDGIEFEAQDATRNGQTRSSIVQSLAASREGGFWFGLGDGAFGICRDKRMSFLGRPERGGANLNVHAVMESSKGDLWIGAQTLAARLTSDKQFQIILGLEPGKDSVDVNTVFEDSHGRVWLGTSRRGLFYWQNGALKKFSDPIFEDLAVHSIAEDNAGQIWVGTQLGVLCYDSHFQRLPLPWPSYECKALHVDRHGAMWAGTTGGGVARYANLQATYLRKLDGLADDFVNALEEDREGNMWIGTRNGLSQLSDVKLPTFGKTEGIQAEVDVAVAKSSKGGLWIAGNSGFGYYDGSYTGYSTNVGLRNLFLLGIHEARNGDVYVINGQMDVEICSAGRIVARYANTNWPTAMCEDSQSVIVAAGNQFYRVGTNLIEPYTIGGKKLDGTYSFSMLADKDDSLWLGTSEGIAHVTASGTRLWPANKTSDGQVFCMCQDSQGAIWGGSTAGILRVKDGDCRVIAQEDGLPSSIVYAMVIDDYGSLWAHSARGFFRASLRSLNDFAEGRTSRVQCELFNSQSAVRSSDRNEQKFTACKTLDGRVWFPTAQGVVMINPTNIPGNSVPPRIHIDQVRANGKELDVRLNQPVQPGRGELEFEYVGLSYHAPRDVQYRYRLDGYDKDWIPAGTRRSAFYTNLKPGPYRFEVQACNEDGVWSTQPDTAVVELLPHFYQATWFFWSVGSAIALGLLGIYGGRVTQLRRAQRRLEARVEQRTAALRKEIDERKRMQQKVEHIHEQLLDASRKAGQAEVATNVLHNVGNVLNSINISSTLISDRLRASKIAGLAKVTGLLHERKEDLGQFLTEDERGRNLVPYLECLMEELRAEQDGLLSEARSLSENVGHIRDVIVMQQSYARIAGFTETVVLADIVENAARMNSATFAKHSVELLREYEQVPPVTLDKHRLLQILVNLLRNARIACDEAENADKQVRIRIQRAGERRVRIEVADNGVGIAPENMTRIFAHGFTTRKTGHGFGLHSAALAAKEMEGTLTAASDGLGRGAIFTLELPIKPDGGQISARELSEQ